MSCVFDFWKRNQTGKEAKRYHGNLMLNIGKYQRNLNIVACRPIGGFWYNSHHFRALAFERAQSMTLTRNHLHYSAFFVSQSH